MNPTNLIPNTHQFLISFPDWFYFVLTGGLVFVVFFLGKLYCRIDEICKDHPKIRQALTRISEILLQREFAKDLVYTQSPVTLTEKGIKALKEADFEGFYRENRNFILDKIKKDNPKTLADLEESCKNLMLSVDDKYKNFEAMKQYAFSHGEPISKILFAAAIALRDKLSSELNIR